MGARRVRQVVLVNLSAAAGAAGVSTTLKGPGVICKAGLRLKGFPWTGQAHLLVNSVLVGPCRPLLRQSRRCSCCVYKERAQADMRCS